MSDIKNLVKCLNDKAQGEIFWLGLAMNHKLIYLNKIVIT